MEQIIIAMIYLYPGALVDIIRRKLFSRTYADEETSDSGRTAKYFIFSTVISVISLLVYGRLSGKSIANSEDIKSAFSATMEIPCFFLISLIVTILFSFFLEGMKILWGQIRSGYLKKTEKMTVNRSSDAWHEIVYGETLREIRGMLVLKTIQNEHEEMGACFYLPDTFENGIALMKQNEVAEALKHDKQEEDDSKKIIYGPIITYCDTKTGTIVEIYNGERIFQNKMDTICQSLYQDEVKDGQLL